MTAGRNTKMLNGAIMACALPVGLGILLTGGLLTSGRPNNLFMSLPIALCLVFGAPLSAWLACRRLRKIADPARLARWRTSFWACFLWSSAVHIAAALTYTIGFTAWVARDAAQSGRDTGEDFFLIFYMSGVMNLVLWCILTVPFALICATIFWRVTKFPKDVSVF